MLEGLRNTAVIIGIYCSQGQVPRVSSQLGVSPCIHYPTGNPKPTFSHISCPHNPEACQKIHFNNNYYYYNDSQSLTLFPSPPEHLLPTVHINFFFSLELSYFFTSIYTSLLVLGTPTSISFTRKDLVPKPPFPIISKK